MECYYRDYRISSVYGRVDAELTDELVDFWLRNGALPDAQTARQRAPQVVFVARNTEGRIVGVTTVYVAAPKGRGRYYIYRMFIQPTDRVYGMMTFLTAKTRDHLGGLDIPEKPKGVVAVTENPKLMRPAARREFERTGFTHSGKTGRGFDIWISDFD